VQLGPRGNGRRRPIGQRQAARCAHELGCWCIARVMAGVRWFGPVALALCRLWGCIWQQACNGGRYGHQVKPQRIADRQQRGELDILTPAQPLHRGAAYARPGNKRRHRHALALAFFLKRLG
jgi:hypothetical protein